MFLEGIRGSQSRKSFLIFAAAILILSQFFLVFGGRTSAATLNDHKLDQEFYSELSAADSSNYYDVIVTFNSKSSTDLLSVFNRDVKTFNVLPMARILLNKDEITDVTQWSEVQFVEPNRKLELLNAEGREMTKSEEVQAQLGFDGTGVEVAVVDTGTDGTHPDLDDNLLYNWQVVGNFVGDKGYISSTSDGIEVQTELVDATLEAGAPVNTDEYGHGTHVYGTISGTGEASDGHQRGMAPKAKVHSYSSSAGIFLVFTLEAYDHIISSVRQGTSNIKVVNNSWGSSNCEFFPNNATNRSTRIAFEEGILSVFAYGNSGPSPNTCNPYATAPYVLGIAATDKSFKITGFSSRGKLDGNYDREAALKNLYDYLNATVEEQQNWDYSTKPIGLYRPSVAAPGANIVSAQNPAHPMTLSGSNYGAASGTSMAAPHVSGVMALILQAYKEQHQKDLSPVELIRLTEVTANKDVMFGYDTHDTGAGFIDAAAAVERAINNDIPTAVTENDLVNYEPPATVKVESDTYSGTVLVDSYQTDIGYGLHEIDVKEGALKVYADVSWATELEKVYISLYKPGADVENDEPSVISAGLLDITNTRYVEFNFPEPGIWKVRIDGRVNLATDYEGKWEVHYPDNAYPNAEVEVVQDKVKSNSDPIDFTATVNDPDGVSDLTNVSVVVRNGAGKVIGSWSKSDFEIIDTKNIKLTVNGFTLSGKAPWTVEVKVEDSVGHKVFDSDFVGKE
jgi:serine protease AprX